MLEVGRADLQDPNRVLWLNSKSTNGEAGAIAQQLRAIGEPGFCSLASTW